MLHVAMNIAARDSNFQPRYLAKLNAGQRRRGAWQRRDRWPSADHRRSQHARSLEVEEPNMPSIREFLDHA
jgi:hypothetical protein